MALDDVKSSINDRDTAPSAVEIYRAVMTSAEEAGIPSINNPTVLEVVEAAKALTEEPDNPNLLANLEKTTYKASQTAGGSMDDTGSRAQTLYNLTIAGLDTGKFTIGLSNTNNSPMTKDEKAKKQRIADNLLREASNNSIAAAAEAAAKYASERLGISEEQYETFSKIVHDGLSPESKRLIPEIAEKIPDDGNLPSAEQEEIEKDVKIIAEDIQQILEAHPDYVEGMSEDDKFELIKIIIADQILASKLSKDPTLDKTATLESIMETLDVMGDDILPEVLRTNKATAEAQAAAVIQAGQSLSQIEATSDLLNSASIMRARYTTMEDKMGDTTYSPGTENEDFQRLFSDYNANHSSDNFIKEQNAAIEQLVEAKKAAQESLENVQKVTNDSVITNYYRNQIADLDTQIQELTDQLNEYEAINAELNDHLNELDRLLATHQTMDPDGLGIADPFMLGATSHNPNIISPIPSMQDKIDALTEEIADSKSELTQQEAEMTGSALEALMQKHGHMLKAFHSINPDNTTEENFNNYFTQVGVPQEYLEDFKAAYEEMGGNIETAEGEQAYDAPELKPDEAQLSFDANKSEIYALYSANPQHDEASIKFALKTMGIPESQIEQVMQIAANDPDLQNLAPTTANTPTQTAADIAMKPREVEQASNTPAANAGNNSFGMVS